MPFFWISLILSACVSHSEKTVTPPSASPQISLTKPFETPARELTSADRIRNAILKYEQDTHALLLTSTSDPNTPKLDPEDVIKMVRLIAAEPTIIDDVMNSAYVKDLLVEVHQSLEGESPTQKNEPEKALGLTNYQYFASGSGSSEHFIGAAATILLIAGIAIGAESVSGIRGYRKEVLRILDLPSIEARQTSFEKMKLSGHMGKLGLSVAIVTVCTILFVGVRTTSQQATILGALGFGATAYSAFKAYRYYTEWHKPTVEGTDAAAASKIRGRSYGKGGAFTGLAIGGLVVSSVLMARSGLTAETVQNTPEQILFFSMAQILETI